MSSRRRRGGRDLVVIGGGSAGLVAADFGARFGADVLLIERGRIGGDCTWTGCVPSKTLLHVAGIAHRVRHASHLGIRTAEITVDFKTVMRRVRQAIAAVYSFETPEQLASRGIDVEQGEARFLDEDTVEVDGHRVQGRRFVICTGAEPQIPPIPGLDRVPHLTYEDVFDLDELPQRLLVLGGGPIGVELAQAFVRLGSQVTLLEKEARLLPTADPEAARILTDRLEAEGVRIETALDIQQVRTDGAEIVVASARSPIAGDRLLVATGRRPRVQGLDLDRARVEFDEHGICVDRRLRTSRHHIYAAGDVIGSFQFTHYAGWQGFAAARSALLPGSQRGVAETVPWAVFTEPEIAQVGLTEDEARARRRKVLVHRFPLERVDRAQTTLDPGGFIKAVTSEAGRILGATAVAPSAGELANELGLAMAAGLGLRQIASVIHIYPTIGFGIQQLAAEFALERASSGLRGALARALMGRNS